MIEPMSNSSSRKGTVMIAPILVVLFATYAPAQTRQAQTQATPTTQTTPVTTPAPVQPQLPGRGGRGTGMPGPGPAVGGEVDETPSVTHHSIQLNGKTLNYTATAAQMPLKD